MATKTASSQPYNPSLTRDARVTTNGQPKTTRKVKHVYRADTPTVYNYTALNIH